MVRSMWQFTAKCTIALGSSRVIRLWLPSSGRRRESVLTDTRGGAEAILEFAGTDASQPFDEIQHSNDALEILDTLRVGELESGSGKVRQSFLLLCRVRAF